MEKGINTFFDYFKILNILSPNYSSWRSVYIAELLRNILTSF